MEPKTQLCPYCGKIMSADYDYDSYYNEWNYTCLNKSCPSKDIKALKEKENETYKERAKLYKERYEMVMKNTVIGRMLDNFKSVYSEEVNEGLLPIEVREILSLELQNLSKM